MYDIRAALLQACRLSSDTDLTQLHTDPAAKYNMLQALTENYTVFQATVVQFFLDICAPRKCYFY